MENFSFSLSLPSIGQVPPPPPVFCADAFLCNDEGGADIDLVVLIRLVFFCCLRVELGTGSSPRASLPFPMSTVRIGGLEAVHGVQQNSACLIEKYPLSIVVRK